MRIYRTITVGKDISIVFYNRLFQILMRCSVREPQSRKRNSKLAWAFMSRRSSKPWKKPTVPVSHQAETCYYSKSRCSTNTGITRMYSRTQINLKTKELAAKVTE